MVAAAAGCAAERDASASASASVRPEATISPSPQESPSSAPSGTGTLQPTAGPLAVAWEEPEPFAGQPLALIVDGEGWIAAGRGAERGPAAWTSSDAVTWSSADVPDPQPHDSFLGSGLGPTVRLGDSLLSFGTFIGCCDGRGVLAWRSADGTAWEVIESDSPLFEQGYLVQGLAVGDPALVAVELQYVEFGGRIWRWTEETSWIEITPGAASGELSGIEARDVVWSEDRFVVVGARGDRTDPNRYGGTSWVSADGATWEESTATGDLAGVRLETIESLPAGGYVAIGWTGVAPLQVAPLAFTSTDGLSWSPVDGAFAESRWLPEDLVSVDGGLVAFGSASDRTVAWSTRDGLTWTDHGEIGASYMAAASLGDRLVAFTRDQAEGRGTEIHRATLGGG